MFELAPVDAGDCVQLTIIILHYCISVSTLMAVELHQLPASQPGTLSLGLHPGSGEQYIWFQMRSQTYLIAQY